MAKAEIRKEIKKQRNMITTEEQKILSSAIRDRLLQTIEYRNCTHVFTFVSFGSEVDTLEIIQQAIIDRKRVYIPRVEAHGLEFYEINKLEGLIASKFGVLEPPMEEENRYNEINIDMESDKDINSNKDINIDKHINSDKDSKTDNDININHDIYDDRNTKVNCYKTKNLMILPGLAFDYTGNRIGYGAGYYDRYLSTFKTEHFYNMALAYDFQLLEQITTEEYDVKVDAILTPTQRIQCS